MPNNEYNCNWGSSSISTAQFNQRRSNCCRTDLVISIQMFKEGKQLNSIHKVKSTFFYSKTNDFYYKYMRPYTHAHQNQQLDSEDQGHYQQFNQVNDWLSNIYTDQKQLTERLKEYKGTTTGQKLLPNFVFMAREIRISHTLVRTMHSMLNQRIDEDTASKINDNFTSLIVELQKFGKNFQGEKMQMEKECFFNALKDGLKTDKQIVKWYTDETFVYKVINSLLRAHRHPAQVFYIQPYVKLLFNTIHKLYIQQSKEIKEKTKIWEFKVYRGGKMNKEQFDMFKKNKNQTIQNLGFFSTTLDLKTANKFQKKGNTLFQVDVVQHQIGASQFGFLNIEKWDLSQNDQKQILFNPLNTFEIFDVQQPTLGEYFIKLRYRLFDDAQKEKQKQDLEQSWRKIAQLQKQEKYQNECQGNALTNQYYHFKEGDKYWNKYLQLVSNVDEKNRNQFNEIKKKSSGEKLKISSQQLQFGNSKIVSFQENIKQSNSQTSIQRNIEEQIAFNKLKQVYGRWNLIFNQVINQKLISYKINDFKFELTNLFGNEHPISLKFLESLQNSLDSLKYLFNYQPYKKQQGSLFKQISEKEIFEKQPQFVFLDSVIVNIFQHHQKQKQRITKKLNLSSSQLNDKTINEIREIFTEQVEQLTLDWNQLTRIPQFIYEMKNLRKISIKNNKLRQFKEELQEQQIIKMQQKNNQQNTINENQLNENQRKKIQIKEKLKQYKIQEDKKNCQKQKQQEKGNEIDQIKREKNQHRVQKQKRIKNKLSRLPQSIGNLTSLYLNNNQLSSLPESIGNLTSLRSIYLNNNKLSSLPESIGNLTSLPQLNLNYNILSSLPESIGNLTSLPQLNLNYNILSSLPESIGNLTSLRSLYLNNNQLSSLPESIGNLTSLRSLSLNNNQLSSLPESIGNLTSLLQLSLNNNQLFSLPQSLGNLTALKSLYFSDNHLSCLPESIGNLAYLNKLSLTNNNLISIPQSFPHLIKLSELDLSSNKLSILPNSFQRLISLRTLRINNNSFHHSSKSILQLTSLQQLNVSNNDLAQLPSIQKLVNLRILNVSFNPISSSALGLISQNQIKILVDQKQMSVIQTQKCSTKSILFVVDSSKKNSVKPNVD